jgi:hypothetical protein
LIWHFRCYREAGMRMTQGMMVALPLNPAASRHAN